MVTSVLACSAGVIPQISFKVKLPAYRGHPLYLITYLYKLSCVVHIYSTVVSAQWRCSHRPQLSRQVSAVQRSQTVAQAARLTLRSKSYLVSGRASTLYLHTRRDTHPIPPPCIDDMCTIVHWRYRWLLGTVHEACLRRWLMFPFLSFPAPPSVGCPDLVRVVSA